MATITRQDFERRHAELTDALRLADDSYSQACFALETGTGSEQDVEKAGRHREAIKSRLDGLKTAFAQSKREAESQRDRDRAAAHAELSKAVGKELESRSKALRDVIKSAEALAKALSEHDAGRERIRHLVNAYRRDHDNKVEPAGIVTVLGNCQFLPTVAGAVIHKCGIQPTLIVGRAEDIANRPPEDREEYDASTIAAFVARLLPAEVDPA